MYCLLLYYMILLFLILHTRWEFSNSPVFAYPGLEILYSVNQLFE